MVKITERYNCVGCGACANGCQRDAIRMVCDVTGFYAPEIDAAKCVDCGNCVRICPGNFQPDESSSQCFAMQSLEDEGVLLKSSSGGAFGLFAGEILKRNGVVYGAAYVSPHKVAHVRIDNTNDLNKLRGSKYVQSYIGESMRLAKRDLDQGRFVLYSGTPCQIAGFKRFIRREYETLLCIGIVCHGIPSPMVYREYLSQIERRNLSEVDAVNFRDKRKGWRRYSLKIRFNNGKELCQEGRKNEYMRGFVNNLFSNEACAKCKFKLDTTLADITIGDFWGIDSVQSLRISNIDRGVSFVAVSTSRGRDVLSYVCDRSFLEEVSLDDAIRYNPSIVSFAGENIKRDYFIRNIKSTDFAELINECLGELPKESIRVKLKRMAYRIYGRVRKF